MTGRLEQLTAHVTMTAAVSPALPHLSDGDRTVVTVSNLMAVNTQEQIEHLLPGLGWGLVQDLAAAITAHPRRPTPNEAKSLQHWEFIHEVNTGVYPQLRPTPADPGHMPGSWMNCPRCIQRLTEQGDRTP
jgi:hypothetical protein